MTNTNAIARFEVCGGFGAVPMYMYGRLMLSGYVHKVCLSLPCAAGVQFFILALRGEGRHAEFPHQFPGAAIFSAAIGIDGVRRKRRRYPETVKSPRTV